MHFDVPTCAQPPTHSALWLGEKLSRHRACNTSTTIPWAYQRINARPAEYPLPGSPTSPERHTIHAPNAPSIPVQSTVHRIAIRQTHFPAPSRARPTRIYTRRPRPNNGHLSIRTAHIREPRGNGPMTLRTERQGKVDLLSASDPRPHPVRGRLVETGRDLLLTRRGFDGAGRRRDYQCLGVLTC